MIIIDNDNSLVESGVWADFGGSQFLIAGYNNPKFQRTLTRLQAPHRRKIEKGTLDPVESKGILCRAIAEGILMDWKNVKKKDGTVVSYNVELGAQALANNEDLRDFIQEFSLDLSNFKAEDEEYEGNF
jgi:hypothetical protein